MGSITSKSKKTKSEVNIPGYDKNESVKDTNDNRNLDRNDVKKTCRSTFLSHEVSYVFTRRGSMYIDDEGGVAHEFYEEVIPSDPGAKPYMKRQVENLTPQGDVEYDFPRLSGDCDIILCDP